ncbi:hypothetical protein PYCC9005_004682 [Savitreella phatthalungensis]
MSQTEALTAETVTVTGPYNIPCSPVPELDNASTTSASSPATSTCSPTRGTHTRSDTPHHLDTRLFSQTETPGRLPDKVRVAESPTQYIRAALKSAQDAYHDHHLSGAKLDTALNQIPRRRLVRSFTTVSSFPSAHKSLSDLGPQRPASASRRSSKPLDKRRSILSWAGLPFTESTASSTTAEHEFDHTTTYASSEGASTRDDIQESWRLSAFWLSVEQDPTTTPKSMMQQKQLIIPVSPAIRPHQATDNLPSPNVFVRDLDRFPHGHPDSPLYTHLAATECKADPSLTLSQLSQKLAAATTDTTTDQPAGMTRSGSNLSSCSQHSAVSTVASTDDDEELNPSRDGAGAGAGPGKGLWGMIRGWRKEGDNSTSSSHASLPSPDTTTSITNANPAAWKSVIHLPSTDPTSLPPPVPALPSAAGACGCTASADLASALEARRALEDTLERVESEATRLCGRIVPTDMEVHERGSREYMADVLTAVRVAVDEYQSTSDLLRSQLRAAHAALLAANLPIPSTPASENDLLQELEATASQRDALRETTHGLRQRVMVLERRLACSKGGRSIMEKDLIGLNVIPSPPTTPPHTASTPARGKGFTLRSLGTSQRPNSPPSPSTPEKGDGVVKTMVKRFSEGGGGGAAAAYPSPVGSPVVESGRVARLAAAVTA